MASFSAAATPWVTSSALIKNDFHPLTKTELKELVSYFGKNSFGEHMLDDGDGWLIHQGDLTIDGDFTNNDLLIVNGNLTINGSYDDSNRGLGHLIVLGDTQVVNFLSHGFFHAKGQFIASGLIYNYYNDYSFEVRQTVTAQGIVIDDKSSSIGAKKSEFYINTWDLNGGESNSDIETALTILVPELYLPEDPDDAQYVPDISSVSRRVHNNLPLFRQQKATGLIEGLRLIQDEDTDQKTLIALADKDLLLARQLAVMPDPSDALINKLLESTDRLTRLYTAANLAGEKFKLLTDSHLADADIAEGLVENEDAPPALIAKLESHTSPAVQLKLARRENLSDQTIAALANSQHPQVVIALLSYQPNVWRITPDAIDSLIASDNTRVRAAVAYGQINLSQAQTLSQDSSMMVRRELALALRDLVASNKSRHMTLSDINKVADRLYSQNPTDEKLVSNLFIALSDNNQITVIRDNFNLLAPSVARMRNAKSVAYLLAQNDISIVWQALSANPYLSADVQHQLWQRAIKLKDSRDEDDREIAQMILSHLVYHANADEKLLANATQLLISGYKPLSAELLHREDLSLANITLLDNVYRKRAMRSSPMLDNYLSAFSSGHVAASDWAQTLIGQVHSPRELSEWALRTWYDDEQDLLSELDSVAGKSDADWWRALAQSDNEDLRLAAAKNSHTPPDALLGLLSDDEIKYLVVANPSFPADKRDSLLQQDPLFALTVEHPNPDTLRELVANGASQEIRQSALERLEKMK